jgi:hypothetical protein
MAADAGESLNRNRYMNNAPDEQECFIVSVKAGDKVSISCWNQTTTARF